MITENAKAAFEDKSSAVLIDKEAVPIISICMTDGKRLGVPYYLCSRVSLSDDEKTISAFFGENALLIEGESLGEIYDAFCGYRIVKIQICASVHVLQYKPSKELL